MSDKEERIENTPVAMSKREIKIVEWRRKAEVLTRPSLPCLEDFRTVNLSAGCPFECRYCYTQSYGYHPGSGTVAFYANALEKLRKEIPKLKKPPRVYFSTATEPFLPFERILDVQYEIMKLLLEARAYFVISTKSSIPMRFVELFAAHPGRVVVQVGISTLDNEKRILIEPRTASVEKKLDNLANLANVGVGVEARMDPLVPGLTDTDDNVLSVLEAAAQRGIKAAIASFMFLRWGIKFPQTLKLGPWSSRAMRREYTLKITDYCGGGTIWLPSRPYRMERSESMEVLAEAVGIDLKVCRCKNSDLAVARCCHPISPETEALAGEGEAAGQLSLF